jgi:hypothetical protein
MCQSLKGVRGLGDVRSLGDSATLGAEQSRPRCLILPPSVLNTATLGTKAARGSATNQSISAIAVM